MYRSSRPIIADKISMGVQLCVAQQTTDYNMFLGHSINVWMHSSYVTFENTVFTELAGYLSTVIVVRATQVVLYIYQVTCGQVQWVYYCEHTTQQ